MDKFDQHGYSIRTIQNEVQNEKVFLVSWRRGSGFTSSLPAMATADVRFDMLDVLVYGEPHRNIIATKPGMGDPSRFVIIGAHCDSSAYSDPANNAPGADDDGSGVSAVLEIARILASEPLEATVIFAAWTTEEVGLVGSGDFVERAFNSGMNVELYLPKNVNPGGYGLSGRIGTYGGVIVDEDLFYYSRWECRRKNGIARLRREITRPGFCEPYG